jgi:hypothetical protein
MKTMVVLHSAFSLDAAADALRHSIDEEHRTLFSLSGWIGLVLPPCLVLFGTLLPKLGRLLGRSGEQFLLEHLQQTLSARIEEQPVPA